MFFPTLRLLLCCTMLIVPAMAAAQVNPATSALSLEDCARIALQKSPDLAMAQHRLSEARAQLGKAYAPFSPQGNLTANQIEFGQDLAGVVNNGNRYDSNTRTASFGANWNVFNGFRDWDRLKSARFDKDASSDALDATRQQLILQTVQAYYGLLLADKSIEVQEENLKSKQEHFQLARARFKAGIRSYSDLLNAQIQMKQSEVDLITAESRRKSALYALNILLDLPLSAPMKIVDLLSFEPIKESLEANIQTAFVRRPEIRQAQDQIGSARATRNLAYHDLLPALGLNGVYHYNLTRSGSSAASSLPGSAIAYSSPNPFWQVNVGLNFPFWDGGTRIQEIRRSREAFAQAQANLDKLKRSVEKDVSDAFLNLESNQKIYEIAKDQVSAAKEDLKIVTERYKNGSASVLDVVDAQANLLKIQIDSIQSLYNFHIAKFALKQAVGLPLF